MSYTAWFANWPYFEEPRRATFSSLVSLSFFWELPLSAAGDFDFWLTYSGSVWTPWVLCVEFDLFQF